MRRFWITFEFSDEDTPPIGISLGVGVAAKSQKQALATIQQKVFNGGDLPKLDRVLKDVDVSKLDARHVKPNMGTPVSPGIWFPVGYE